MTDFYFCTVASKMRLAHARVLAESLLAHHPEAQIFCLLVDRTENFFDASSFHKKIKLVEAQALKNVPNITELFFKYNAFEAATALKPFFCDYLLRTYNMKKLVYFDSDIYVTMNMGEVNELLDEFSFILTPHITERASVNRPGFNELLFLKHGTLNTGFIGMKNVRETLDFLSWWKDRLRHFCLVNTADGLFLDQKWIDLVPSLFEKFHILKNPGYNVAYWNLHERRLSHSGSRFFVNGELLRFFHFSAFDPDDSEGISRNANRRAIASSPALRHLTEIYRNCLLRNAYKEISAWPYTYNFFDNGVEITDDARRVYRELNDAVKKFGNPFETDKKNAFEKYYPGPGLTGYKFIDKIIEVGKRHKKLLNNFPCLEMQARKFYAFLKFLVKVKAFNFFVRR